MTAHPRARWLSVASAGLSVLMAWAGGAEHLLGQQSNPPNRPDVGSFSFRTGIDLINVTATVTDARGRFVPGLEKTDFLLYDDDELQTISYFSNERVPVSLGIVLDTSGSMDGPKMTAARSALDRFLYDLLGQDDEIFLYEFNDTPTLAHGWTSDRDRLSRAISQIRPRGDTALYDALAEAIPLARKGAHAKKAVVVISDGNDTRSQTDVDEIRELIRESEVLVYAIGIDEQGGGRVRRRSPPPFPFPLPGGRGRSPLPVPSPWPGGGGLGPGGERVNVSALRDLTDESGGRTEIIRRAEDLDPATAGVADELRWQYYLGYAAPGHDDGRWHSIDVEVRNSRYRVRARRGYIASPR